MYPLYSVGHDVSKSQKISISWAMEVLYLRFDVRIVWAAKRGVANIVLKVPDLILFYNVPFIYQMALTIMRSLWNNMGNF